MHSICLSLAAVYTVQEWTASGEHLTFPYKSSYFSSGSIGPRQARGRPSLVSASALIFPGVVESQAQLMRKIAAHALIHYMKIRGRIRRCGVRPLIATSLHHVCTMLPLAANTNSNRRRSVETPLRRQSRWIVVSASCWVRRRYYAPTFAFLTRAGPPGRIEPTREIRIAGPRRSPARFAPEIGAYTTEYDGLAELISASLAVTPSGRPASRRAAPRPSTPAGSADRAARS